MHVSDIQDASIPVFEEELAKAQAELAEVEAAHERGGIRSIRSAP